MNKATSAAAVGLMLLGMSGLARAQGGPRSTISQTSGSVAGVVADEKGAPLAGAIVSATGVSVGFAVTDEHGRYELPDLPQGTYTLRARLAAATSVQTISVRPGARTQSSFVIRPAAPENVPVLAAGFGLAPASPAPAAATPAPAEETDQPATDAGETAWRLRHARRSVLKDSDIAADLFGSDEPTDFFTPLDFAGRAAGTSVRLASSFITDTPFSGEVNLLTASSFESPRELLSTNAMSRGIAYMSLTAPAGSTAAWTVRGAFTQADISAWILSGSYKTADTAKHSREYGFSYSTQRYDGGNPLALRELTDGSRNVGEIYGYDTLAPLPGVSVSYGGRYAQYDYLAGRNLISPRVELTVSPSSDLRVIGSVSSRALAPGAEEFLPPNETGIWLPPQRTFSSLDPGSPMTAENALTAQIGVERTFGKTTLGIGGFHQRVDDQLMTLFGAEMPNQPIAKVGHYFVGSAGDAKATGGTARVESEFGNRVRGSVEYSLSSARLRLRDDLQYIVFLGPSTGRPYAETIHDVSTTVEAVVPETATNVLVVYRFGNGFAHGTQDSEGTSTRRGFDSRFDIQVRQSLPFMDFRTARWQMLVAVRNFFRETAPDQSIYDELLVVRPPKRIVGGLTMLF